MNGMGLAWQTILRPSPTSKLDFARSTILANAGTQDWHGHWLSLKLPRPMRDGPSFRRMNVNLVKTGAGIPVVPGYWNPAFEGKTLQ